MRFLFRVFGEVEKDFLLLSRYVLTRIAWVSHHHRIFLFPIPHIFRKDPIRSRTPCYQGKQREGEKVVTESRLIGRCRRPTWVWYREQPRIPNPTQKLTVSNLRTAELREKRQTTEGQLNFCIRFTPRWSEHRAWHPCAPTGAHGEPCSWHA